MSKPRRSLGGPWSKLAKQPRKPAAVPRSSASSEPTKKVIVDSVESWEELDNGTTFLSLPQNKIQEEDTLSNPDQDAIWDNTSTLHRGDELFLSPGHYMYQSIAMTSPTKPRPPTTTPTTTTATTATTTHDYTAELAQYHMLSISRPMLLINAKVARAESAKSLSQSALREIQGQLQEALANDFEERVEQLFRSGVCFHTDSSNHGARLERDRSVLQALYPGEKFVSIEYPHRYVGNENVVAIESVEESSRRSRSSSSSSISSSSKASLWENVTLPSSSRAITMLTACIRECHHSMEWKSAMRSEIDRLGQKQSSIIEKRTIREMELIQKCDQASKDLNSATAAVIQYHDGFASAMGKKGVSGGGGVGGVGGVGGGSFGSGGSGDDDEEQEEDGAKFATLDEARQKINSSKLASTSADLEFAKFEKRQRRRERRLERRRAEEQARKDRTSAAHSETEENGSHTAHNESSNRKTSSTAATSAAETVTDTAAQQQRKMSLLDQIIAVVFDGLPLGQRIPVEVGGSTNHIDVASHNDHSHGSDTVDMKVRMEEHFRCLLGAQLRLRHQWIVDFGFVPLHEFDRGVESNTDSDSDGDQEEEERERDRQKDEEGSDFEFGGRGGGGDVYNSDSGSDGWRRRGGGMGGGLNWDDDEDDEDNYEEGELGYEDRGTKQEGSGGGGSGGGGDGGGGATGFHVISTPSFLRG